ncbi:MAG: hypothetical protein WCC36_10080 [Gammaproteobacteria bacterium]
MSKQQLWYGYLEAGAKSTAVVLDHKIDTGNTLTVYLFNLARNEILEYRREIVESKLRAIGAEERELLDRLKDAYRKARRAFEPRMARSPSAATHNTAQPARRKQTPSGSESYGIPVEAGVVGDNDPEVDATWYGEND